MGLLQLLNEQLKFGTPIPGCSWNWPNAESIDQHNMIYQVLNEEAPRKPKDLYRPAGEPDILSATKSEGGQTGSKKDEKEEENSENEPVFLSDTKIEEKDDSVFLKDTKILTLEEVAARIKQEPPEEDLNPSLDNESEEIRKELFNQMCGDDYKPTEEEKGRKLDDSSEESDEVDRSWRRQPNKK